jgi:6,7-dimethyl-8-ribityllumazine synthase
MPATTRGDLRGDGLRVAVLVARWNADVTDRLRDGALAALSAAGVRDEDVTVLEVPGAFELPAAARRVAASGRVDAVVALGCLLKGETRHDEVIADACAKGLVDVSTATGVPVGFGVITAGTRAQALARSDSGASPGKGGHKGREAAEAAVALARALRTWDEGARP